MELACYLIPPCPPIPLLERGKRSSSYQFEIATRRTGLIGRIDSPKKTRGRDSYSNFHARFPELRKRSTRIGRRGRPSWTTSVGDPIVLARPNRSFAVESAPRCFSSKIPAMMSSQSLDSLRVFTPLCPPPACKKRLRFARDRRTSPTRAFASCGETWDPIQWSRKCRRPPFSRSSRTT